ncbi:MAG: DeoR/GlpR transcriptional regulator [Anaerolineae bacterium]|nr:DeoR/GlpR transcriptional regulator [Anaerolineae bacterium]
MNRRRDELLEMLLDRGRLRVDELTAHFGVTGMTVRRDLDALEKEGLLIRTHGGCVLQTPQVQELPFREKEQLHREAKETIARAVVSRVHDGASLYLDTGTTCAMVARLLRRHRRNLQVFTNNLPAALDLFGAEAIEVMIPGGVLGRRSPDLTGEFGLDRLRDIRFDLAIVGADAFDPASGIFYAADLPTAALSQTAQRRADQTFVCVDSSKFNKRALAVAGRLRENVTVFTDGELPAAQRRGLLHLGAEVVIVGRGKTPHERGKE